MCYKFIVISDYLPITFGWYSNIIQIQIYFFLIKLDIDNNIDTSKFIDDLFEYGIFYIYVQPKDYSDAEEIEKIIFEELSNIIKNSDFKENVQRAYKKAKMDNVSIVEDNQKLGFVAAKFLMTEKDPFALNKYTNKNGKLSDDDKKKIMNNITKLHKFGLYNIIIKDTVPTIIINYQKNPLPWRLLTFDNDKKINKAR